MSDLPTPTNIRDIETLLIEDGVKLKPGVKICNGYVVGKVLSHGVQVQLSECMYFTCVLHSTSSSSG